jgi:hypothetical protein
MIGELGPGATLAGYRIESVIGRGGMGVVYLAEDLRLSRKVAIKLIAPGLSSDTRFRERFLREAELTASLDHPHVLPVYGAGETDGQLWTAMRYVEGEDLDRLLVREGPLAPARAVELARQIGEALDAAHARGLVHRDVKPANVLVAPVASGEHCYLTDFGLARAREDEPLAPASPHLSGTVAYSAPERIAGRFVDGRADVYSLGCMLFECLAGEPPYARRRPSATLAAHMDEEPPSVWLLRPQLPEEIDAVVAKALAKDPRERYASCGELTEAARVALAPAEPWWRSLRWVAVGVALIGVAFAAGLAVAFTRGGAEAAAERPAIAGGVNAAAKSPVIAGDSLVRLDGDTGGIVATVPLNDDPPHLYGFRLVADAEHVWFSGDSGTLTRIDADTNEVSATFDLPDGEGVVVWALDVGGNVWLTDQTFGVWRLAPGADSAERFELPGPSESWPVLAGGSLWITTGGHLLRIDPETGRVLARLESVLTTMIAGADFLWGIGHDRLGRERLVRVDTDTNEITALTELPDSLYLGTLMENLLGAVVADGSVWLPNAGGLTTLRLDSVTGAVQGGILERGPFAVDAGTLWTATFVSGTVSRSQGTSEMRTTDVGGAVAALAIAGDSVWVLVDVP